MDRWLLWTGVCLYIVRWLLYIDRGCYRQVVPIDRWLLWTGGYYRQVVSMCKMLSLTGLDLWLIDGWLAAI